MDAESQQIQELKAEILRLKEENAQLVWRDERKSPLIIEQAKLYEESLSVFAEHNHAKNEIIRELMTWIDSEFRLDTYLPGSPGKKLWDRAQEAIK